MINQPFNTKKATQIIYYINKNMKFKDTQFDVLVLSDKETEEIIPSDTPEDIWNLIQEHEKKNPK